MRYRLRLIILLALIGFFCFLVVPVRLYQLQVIRGDEFRQMVEERRVRRDRTDAPRGKIFSRDGVLLAAERAAYDLEVRFRTIRNEDEFSSRIAKCLECPPGEVTDRLNALRASLVQEALEKANEQVRKGRATEGFRYRLIEKLEGGRIGGLENPSKLPPEFSIVKTLRRRWLFLKAPTGQSELWIDFSRRKEDDRKNLKKLSDLLGIPAADLDAKVAEARAKMVRAVLRQAGYQTLFADLALEKALRAAFLEQDVPGLRVSPRPVRCYPEGLLAGQLLGNLGKPDDGLLRQWLKDAEDPVIREWCERGVKPESPGLFYASLNEELDRIGLRLDDLAGRSGVEAAFEPVLRGQRGERLVERDYRNRARGVLGEVPFEPGRNVVLSIDSRIQRLVEKEFTRQRGAAVFMDVHTGEVLAAASFPQLDPNELIPPVSQEAARRAYESPTPALNRAISSAYPLGSIFKVLTSVCLLESGAVGPTSEIQCRGPLNPSQPHRFRCWARYGHGAISLREAIKRSCNVYFFACADRAGSDPLLKWATEFEFGVSSGSELRRYESSGLLPTPEWKKQRLREPWYPGDTRNLSIGQGSLLVNPLQVCRMMAAVANGGTLLAPRFVARVVNDQGQEIDFLRMAAVRVKRRLPVSDKTLSAVREGLVAVVNEPGGTALNAFKGSSLPYQVAGKTSTAQTQSETGNVGWFAGFAPADKPEIAFAIVIEGLLKAEVEGALEEHGGDVAAPIVRRVLEQFEITRRESIARVDEQ